MASRSRLLVLVAGIAPALVATIAYREMREGMREAQLLRIRSVASDLRSAQGRFHIENGSYASDLAELGFTVADGLEIRMAAEDDGWSAVAWERERPTMGCAVLEGHVESSFATPGRRLPTEEETLVCDG